MSAPVVLVVEDDTWLGEQYVRILSDAGFEATLVPHAIAAIEAIDDIKPQAIILDVLLTGNTAFTLLHELQSYTDTSELPIILCTNMAAELSLRDVEPYGVRRILDKVTMQPEDMVTALRGVLA